MDSCGWFTTQRFTQPPSAPGSETVTLLQIISECGATAPKRGQALENFRQKFHMVLQRAAAQRQIRPREGPRWVWRASDPDVWVARRLVAEEVERLRARSQGPGAARGAAAISPAAVSSSSQTVSTGGDFQGVASVEGKRPSSNSLRDAAGSSATPAGSCKRQAKPRRNVKLLKRKWLQLGLEDAEAKLRQEWEALPQDAATSWLLTWRYGILQRTGDEGDDCDERMRSILDTLIAQRTAESQPAIGPCTAPGNFEGHEEPGGGVSSFFGRLGLGDVKLPHPAQLSVELDPGFVAALGSDTQDQGAVVAEALQRYLAADEVQRAAWWAVIVNRAWAQEQAVLRALKAKAGGTAPSSSAGSDCESSSSPMCSRPANAFQLFLAWRMRGDGKSLPGPAQASQAAGAADAFDSLAAEGEFLQLPRSVKRRWLSTFGAWGLSASSEGELNAQIAEFNRELMEPNWVPCDPASEQTFSPKQAWGSIVGGGACQ